MTPEGRYVADLVSGTLSESGKGNPQVVLQLAVDQVIDPNTGIQGIPPIERRIYLSYAGGAVEYTEKKLRALKFQGDFSQMVFGVNRIEVNCEHEPKDDGSMKEKWELANWGDAPEIKPASKATILKMNQLWKAKQGVNGTPATPPKAAAVPATTRPAPRQAPKPAGPTATADEAWAALCATHADKADDWRQEEWQKVLGEAQTKFGKPEAEFTGDDWHAVKTSCELPF